MAKLATKSTKGSKTTTASKSNSGKSNGFEFVVECKRSYPWFDPDKKRFTKLHQFVAIDLTAKQISAIKQAKGVHYKADDKGMPVFSTPHPYGSRCTWAVSACGKFVESYPSPERLRYEELRDIEKRTPAQEKEFKALACENL